MAQQATSVAGFDEIFHDIFGNAGTRPSAVDASRAQGSEVMGDSSRQESRTSESFTIVQPASSGGSANSPNMSPEDNSSGVAPVGAPAAAPTNSSNAAPVGASLNAAAPTFAPQVAPPSSVAPIPISDPNQVAWWNHQLMMQQQQAMQYMMMNPGGKGKGLVPPAPPPYNAGPLPAPSVMPPQNAATQPAPTGITDEWALRRAMGSLPPESDIVAGLMASVHRAPGKGKGTIHSPSMPATSSIAPQTDQTAYQKVSSGTSPTHMSSSAPGNAGSSNPNTYGSDYGSHQLGPWPAQVDSSGTATFGIPANQYFDMTADPNRSLHSGMNAAGLIGDRPPGASLPTQPGYQPLPIPFLARHLGSFAPQDWQAE